MATDAYDARVFIRGVPTSLPGAKNIVIHIRRRFYALTTSPPRLPRARRVAFDPSRAAERDVVRHAVVFSQRRVAKRPPRRRRRRRRALTASLAPVVKPIAISIVTARPTTAGPRRAPPVVRRPRSTNGAHPSLVLIIRAREITHALVRAHPASISSSSLCLCLCRHLTADAPSSRASRCRGTRDVDASTDTPLCPTDHSVHHRPHVRVPGSPHQRARAGAGDDDDVLGGGVE